MHHDVVRSDLEVLIGNDKRPINADVAHIDIAVDRDVDVPVGIVTLEFAPGTAPPQVVGADQLEPVPTGLIGTGSGFVPTDPVPLVQATNAITGNATRINFMHTV